MFIFNCSYFISNLVTVVHRCEMWLSHQTTCNVWAVRGATHLSARHVYLCFRNWFVFAMPLPGRNPAPDYPRSLKHNCQRTCNSVAQIVSLRDSCAKVHDLNWKLSRNGHTCRLPKWDRQVSWGANRADAMNLWGVHFHLPKRESPQWHDRGFQIVEEPEIKFWSFWAFLKTAQIDDGLIILVPYFGRFHTYIVILVANVNDTIVQVWCRSTR